MVGTTLFEKVCYCITMKTRYLVDYENVSNHGLNGVESLTENDEVIIFYSDKVNTLTFDTHYKLINTNAKVMSYSAGVGTKNALDFQLVTLLGYLIAGDRQKKWHFCIISKDTGFDNVIRFWKEWGIDVSRKLNISGPDVLIKDKPLLLQDDEADDGINEEPDSVLNDSRDIAAKTVESPKIILTREQFVEECINDRLPAEWKRHSAAIRDAVMSSYDVKSFNAYLAKRQIQNVAKAKLASYLSDFFVSDKVSLTYINKLYDQYRDRK